MGGLVAAVAIVLPCPVWAEVRTRVDVAAESAAETNPFLIAGNDTAAVAAVLRIDPAVYTESETTTAIVEGGLRLEQFSRRYGNDVSGRLRASLRRSVNERTAVRVDASLNSSRSFLRDLVATRAGDGGAPTSDRGGSLSAGEMPVPDVTAAGRRARVTTLSSHAAFDRTLGARDTLSVGVTAGLTRSNDSASAEYQTAGGSVFFRRKVSERAGVFADVRGGFADYRRRRQGDGIHLTPLVGVDYRLSDRLSMNVSIGASFTSLDNGEGRQVRKTTVAGELELCRRETGGNLCGMLSRSAQPTLYGGITSTTSAGLRYVRRLSDRDELSLGGNYGRSEGGLAGAPSAGRRQLVSTYVDYRRELSDRLSGFVTPRYERIFDRASEERDNFAILAGITYRFGSAR